MRIEFEEKLLREFVTCVEKVFSKPKQVGITGDGSAVSMFVAQDEHQVNFSVPLETSAFGVAVEAPRFAAAVKKAYSDVIGFEFLEKSVKLEYESAEVKLPYQTCERTCWSMVNELVETPSGFLESLAHLVFVPDTDPRFTGILVDPVDDGTVLSRFSGTALALCKIDRKVSTRFVISGGFIPLAKTKVDFSHLMISDRGFGLRSQRGVCISSTLLADTYPEGYLESFALSTNGALVDRTAFPLCYEIDGKAFRNAVSLVSSVVGDDDQRVYFSVKGSELLISTKSYKGLKAEETVGFSGILSDTPKTFILHKKTLAKALNNYKEGLFLVDHETAVYLCDETGTRISVLVKLS